MTNVITLKLSSGEEIISRVVKRDETTIILDRPNMIGMVPAGPDGQVGIQLLPWIASNQDSKEVKVSLAHIVAEIVPNDELEKGYLQRTSGIALS